MTTVHRTAAKKITIETTRREINADVMRISTDDAIYIEQNIYNVAASDQDLSLQDVAGRTSVTHSPTLVQY